MKTSIEAFIDLLIDIKRKVNMKGEPSPMLLLAPEVKAFSALSEEDKRKVFEEFKDKLN